MTTRHIFIGLLIVITGIAVVSLFPDSGISHSPGVLVEENPLQQNLSNGNSWQKDDYSFHALAEFEIRAMVLSKEGYSFGRESDISPYDLVLGWGKMSDQSVIDQIDISQRNRWYHWRVDSYPIPKREIETHSANMHMIPANDQIEDQLSDITKGNIIRIKGYLVKVTASDGWNWISSTTRIDTGGGACEIIWVDELEILI